jgi:hypothetical protein
MNRPEHWFYDLPPIPRRDAARLLIAPFAAVCVASPVSAAEVDAQEKTAAARVEKKVNEAKKKSKEEKDETEAFREFKEELADYEALHRKELGRLGSLDEAARPKALAAAIVAKRSHARQGDVLVPEVQPFLKRRIAEQLKGPDTQAARKAVTEGNPGHDEDAPPVAVKINAVYPRGATRSTVPPSVLLTLPTLPECLQYLFVDRDLVLVDSVAQIIVDFLPAAAPALPA